MIYAKHLLYFFQVTLGYILKAVQNWCNFCPFNLVWYLITCQSMQRHSTKAPQIQISLFSNFPSIGPYESITEKYAVHGHVSNFMKFHGQLVQARN